MTKRPIDTSRDPDLRALPLALARAARRARDVAIATRTNLVVFEQGELRRIQPVELPAAYEVCEPGAKLPRGAGD
jgi:hypothetical protein